MDSKTPTCIGFIMDGNRRWATERGEATLMGHTKGQDTFRAVARWVKEANIPHAIFYAFSSENWQRGALEVTYLQELFLHATQQMLTEVDDWQMKIRVVGNLSTFSLELQHAILALETASARYTETTIWVALSYGGRSEIVAACNQAIAKGVPVDETTFGTYLSTAGMPDPDMIIRTGGEQRLSNFLPWQSVYSELFFTTTYWPAFTKDEFTRIVAQYGDRQQRRGT